MNFLSFGLANEKMLPNKRERFLGCFRCNDRLIAPEFSRPMRVIQVVQSLAELIVDVSQLSTETQPMCCASAEWIWQDPK